MHTPDCRYHILCGQIKIDVVAVSRPVPVDEILELLTHKRIMKKRRKAIFIVRIYLT